MQDTIRLKNVWVIWFQVVIIFFLWNGTVKSQDYIGPLLDDDILIDSGDGVGDKADVAYGNNRYLVVWSHYFDHNFYYSDIYGQFINSSGELDGSPFLIFHQTYNDHHPAVAFNGAHYLVVWYHNFPNSIRGQLVGTDGSLIGSEIIICSGHVGDPEVASNGTDFIVVWEDERDHATNYFDISGQLVSGLDGSMIGSNFQISPGPEYQFHPSVEFGNENYLVVWQNQFELNGEIDLYGALVSSSGGVSSPIAISTAPGSQGSSEPPSISFDGINFLVVWEDYPLKQIYGARISNEGILLDGPPDTGGIIIAPDHDTCFPHGPQTTFSGTSWLVVWGDCLIRGARVNSEGEVLETSGGVNLFKTYLSSQWNPGIAFGDGSYLVTWRLSTSYPRYAQLVGLLDTDGDSVPDDGSDSGTSSDNLCAEGVLENCDDNCFAVPNGPNSGTCTSGTVGVVCENDVECGPEGYCSMNQEDSYPPQGNNCGDACECEGNFDGDGDCDGSDVFTFKTDFGRNLLRSPCESDNPCNGDFDCDGDVDGTDAAKFKEDFGRSPLSAPCPTCPTDPWCAYP